jgi:hypothetical protein
MNLFVVFACLVMENTKCCGLLNLVLHYNFREDMDGGSCIIEEFQPTLIWKKISSTPNLWWYLLCAFWVCVDHNGLNDVMTKL